MAKVTSLKVALQPGSTTELYASWEFASKYAKNLDKYKVTWTYGIGIGKSFTGSSSEQTTKTSTYSIPSNATSVKVTVKPASKTRTVKKKKKAYWTGTSVSKTYAMKDSKPEKLSVPTVAIDKYKLTAKIENIIDPLCDKVEFYVVNGNKKVGGGTVSKSTNRAVFSCNVSAGGVYRVKCRAVNVKSNKKLYNGDWSDYSSEISTIPATVKIKSCDPDSVASVKIILEKAVAAISYEIEYSVDQRYLGSESSSKVTSESTTVYITGLDTGNKYFFRARAKNDQGESSWSSIVHAILGTKPEPPTTWSTTTTAIVGETVTLCWVHNCEDGSKQSSAEIELNVNGIVSVIPIYSLEVVDSIYYYTLDLSNYEDGAEILWRVRTKGLIDSYSDWSIQRLISIYVPPTLELNLGDDSGLLNTFPFTISMSANPTNQKPISYQVSVIANSSYEVEDYSGDMIRITEGAEVFSQVFNISDNAFSFDLLPSNIILENNQEYTVKALVSMNTGLTAESSDIFTVEWADDFPEPDAAIVVDQDDLSAYISPYCTDNDDNLIETVTLSVYRREADGKFTEIATDLENDGVVTVTDPHPALDYARYRIVARSTKTSIIGFEDLPGEPVNEKSVVIQWDEEYTKFDYSGDIADEEEIPTWTGSMLKLPYNINTSEKHNADVSLINYIGRKHPVSYYGTQLGETSNWTVSVEKEDKETIYALRRLAVYNGDVYVREPSGVGYWAYINVSLDIKSTSATVPASFGITRVEGGI